MLPVLSGRPRLFLKLRINGMTLATGILVSDIATNLLLPLTGAFYNLITTFVLPPLTSTLHNLYYSVQSCKLCPYIYAIAARLTVAHLH